LEKEEDLEINVYTQLWDLSHIQAQHEVVLSGETIPALFGTP
jgi:hypothetical protein